MSDFSESKHLAAISITVRNRIIVLRLVLYTFTHTCLSVMEAQRHFLETQSFICTLAQTVFVLRLVISLRVTSLQELLGQPSRRLARRTHKKSRKESIATPRLHVHVVLQHGSLLRRLFFHRATGGLRGCGSREDGLGSMSGRQISCGLRLVAAMVFCVCRRYTCQDRLDT